MGGGAPLAFLNKKTWHPGRFQNQEEVWKREQEAAAEQRKLDELRKQYEDERKASEFTQMAEEAGYKRDAKLDWMYAGSLAAKQDADARNDAAAAAAAPATAGVPTAAALQQQQEQPLMAPRPAANESLSRAEAAARLPSFLAADTPASQNEAWARLNNDPLLAIKKQEQDSLRRVRDNPVKMQQILKEVEKVRSKHKKEKKEKKEKKDKKDKRDKRGREHSSDGRPPPSGAAGAKRGRSRSASPRRPPRYAAPPPAAAGAPGQGLHHGSRGAWAGDRQHSTAGGGSGRQQREPDRCRGRSRSRSRERARRGDEHREQQHSGRQQQTDEPRQQQRDAGDRHHHHGHQHHSSAGRIGGGGGGSYGLDLGPAGARGGVLGSAEAAAAAAERAAATRQRLAEAAAAKEAAAAAAAAAKRHQRRDYKAGGLSAEEKAARLAEMTGNAAQHEQQRLERLTKAHAAENESDRGAAALLAKAAAVRAEDAFASAAAAEVFGSMAGSGMSLDARISSRRHYHER